MSTAQATISIDQAIRSPDVFRRFLMDSKGSIESWNAWRVLLKAAFGCRLRTDEERETFKQFTGGRDPNQIPEGGYKEITTLCGRQGGKSVAASLAAVYSALFCGLEAMLHAGDVGLIPVIAPSKAQAKIIKGHIRAIFKAPMLARELSGEETKEGFSLAGGRIRVSILSSDWRTTRGFRLLMACIDEAAFLMTEEAAVSDIELVRSLRPSLLSTGGKLWISSSPYARKGLCWDTFQSSYGVNDDYCLVWRAPTWAMNPLTDMKGVERAYKRDPMASKAELGAEFRDDVGSYISEELVRACVEAGCEERFRNPGVRYHAGYDGSGGRHDAACLVISHRDEGRAILDLIRVYPAPHSPHEVVGRAAAACREWGIARVIGDPYSGDWIANAFAGKGIKYQPARASKSEIYIDVLPRLCSNQVVLLDHEQLIKELSNLERRTRMGGHDLVDHPPGLGNHDDVANAAALAIDACLGKSLRVGAL